MAELPEPIQTTMSFESGYYEFQRPDRDILDDLVSTVNKLIEYLEDKKD